MARKKKNWFEFVKKLFRLDARSKAEKKERRRRWAFEKLNNKRLPPPITCPPQRAVLNIETEQVQSKSALNVAIATAAAAEAAAAAAQIAAEVYKLRAGDKFSQTLSTASQNKHGKDVSSAIRAPRDDKVRGDNPPFRAAHQCEMKARELQDLKVQAAIKIQAAFRGFLARKALRALKGIVKLQAIIRGRAVRRQAITTLKRLQSIVNIHSQVCETRSRVGERDGGYNDNCQTRQCRDRTKVEKSNNPRRWDDSLLLKDKEDAMVVSKREAAIKRERIREYSFHHRKSAESENRKPNGRWRYWLEQWVDTQLNKSREFEDLDPVLNPNPKSDNTTVGPRRNFKHKKQSSMGEGTFPSSPSIPTYMAATESARAKTRSSSSPKLRPGAFDTHSDSYSPYKNKLCLVSSVVSEVPVSSCSYKGPKQRSLSLKGFSSSVKSGRVVKDLDNLE